MPSSAKRSSYISESAQHRVASAFRGASPLGERSGTPGVGSPGEWTDGLPTELAGVGAGRAARALGRADRGSAGTRSWSGSRCGTRRSTRTGSEGRLGGALDPSPRIRLCSSAQELSHLVSLRVRRKFLRRVVERQGMSWNRLPHRGELRPSKSGPRARHTRVQG